MKIPFYVRMCVQTFGSLSIFTHFTWSNQGTDGTNKIICSPVKGKIREKLARKSFKMSTELHCSVQSLEEIIFIIALQKIFVKLSSPKRRI